MEALRNRIGRWLSDLAYRVDGRGFTAGEVMAMTLHNARMADTANTSMPPVWTDTPQPQPRHDTTVRLLPGI